MSKKAAQPTPSAPVVRELSSIVEPIKPEAVAPWKLYKDLKLEAFTKQKEAFAAAAKKDDETEPKLSDFGIEDARVRRHLDKHGLNGAITAVVNELKEKYKPEEGKTEAVPRSPEDEAKRNAVLAARVRIGNMVPECIRAFGEEIANDLIHIAIESALRSERKIVHGAHIFDYDCFYVQFARFRNLFESLPAFTEARTKCMLATHKQQIAAAANAYLGEFSRYINTNGQAKFQAVRTYLSGVDDDNVEEDEHAEDAPAEKDTRFTFYIKKMLKVIRESDPRTSKLRFSKNFTPLINDIITEFISLVAVRALVQINIAQAETVSESVIRTVIVSMLATPAALSERVITSIASQPVVKTTTKELTENGTTRTVKQTETVNELVATIATPAFITFADGAVPRVVKSKAKAGDEPATSEAAKAPAAPVAKPAEVKENEKEKEKEKKPAKKEKGKEKEKEPEAPKVNKAPAPQLTPKQRKAQ